MVYIIVSWLVLCCVVGFVANSIGRSFGAYFFLSLFLSPLIGFIVLAIKGKVTEEERQAREYQKLDDVSHVYVCNNCGKVYYGAKLAENNDDSCNHCKNKLVETTFLKGEWNEISSDKRTAIKEEIKAGKYIRNKAKVNPEVQFIPAASVSPADEIEKFKGLLDKGIITQEEFDAKKKQLLGL